MLPLKESDAQVALKMYMYLFKLGETCSSDEFE